MRCAHLDACGIFYDVKAGEQISIVRDEKTRAHPLGTAFRIGYFLLMMFGLGLLVIGNPFCPPLSLRLLLFIFKSCRIPGIISKLLLQFAG